MLVLSRGKLKTAVAFLPSFMSVEASTRSRRLWISRQPALGDGDTADLNFMRPVCLVVFPEKDLHIWIRKHSDRTSGESQ